MLGSGQDRIAHTQRGKGLNQKRIEKFAGKISASKTPHYNLAGIMRFIRRNEQSYSVNEFFMLLRRATFLSLHL